MFKRPSVHYGRTAQPVTPYQKAAQVWDDRIGSARVQARNWRLMAFGCLLLSGGLAAGLGAAYVLHQLRPVFSSTRQLMELTQLPVLGSVSMTWPERHHARARRAVWSYALGTVLLIALGIVALLTDDLASQFLHGVIA